MACFCTGACQSDPSHPCNGGIVGRRPQQGWICPKCGAVNGPWAFKCYSCPPSSPYVYPRSDCGCAPNQVCMNTACPRRIQVTCSTEADFIGRWETDGGRTPGILSTPGVQVNTRLTPLTQKEIEDIIKACRDQL